MRTTSIAQTSQEPPVPASPTRQWSHAVTATAGLTTLGAVVFGPLWQEYPEVAAGSILFTAMFSGAGVILWDEPGHRRTAVLLILAGQFWALGWSEEWEFGPLPFISGPSSYLALSLAAWAMFRYPDPALMNRLEKVFVRVVAVAAVGGILAETLTMQPGRNNDFLADSWWITLSSDPVLHLRIVDVVRQTQVVVVVLFLALWLVRIRRMRGLDRELLTPMALASPVIAVAVGAVPVAKLLGFTGSAMDQVYAFQPAALAVIPLAFLISVVRRRLADNAVLTLIQQVQRRPTPEAVQTALRTALRDATLRVRYWAPELNTHVDVTGAPAGPPAPQDHRLVLPVTAPSGEPLAVVDTVPGLQRHTQLVTNALAASGLALENAQLQAAVLGRLSQVRAVRMEAVRAGVAERRRVERDLHDGAQQRLLALRLVLAASDRPELSTQARSQLQRMSREIALALNELRDLARGIHPAVLSQAGLSAAIEAVAQKQPILVHTSLPAGRFPAATEETAYYLICAALKGASRVSIRGHETDGVLTIEVEDDARRPAQLRLDAELPGMLDRVRALGGDIMFSTLSRGGSLMVAAIPCA